ncbi:XRE family transcriptional regulator [Methanosarcina sp. MSH10X1]|uniref:helix-turn-helix domain-containing protein n=1 Tax=Methanosarcina sp. MSH10X1 TaxID=2507075 RepID=UPI000FFBB191|nr:helix-turn-helix transcriptional regulator [Methanosarcina sp. MSH10X1]RXA21717.1 XRE family transcriptional regulator [Methanosarcina sp. MSH10X1]
MKNEEIFGVLIKDARKNKSLSQEKLAEKTGLDRTFISSIETGKKIPTLTSICKLAKGLDMKASELLKLYEEKVAEYGEDST